MLMNRGQHRHKDEQQKQVSVNNGRFRMKADGIGAERAGQIVGASVVNGLIHRPIRSKSDY